MEQKVSAPALDLSTVYWGTYYAGQIVGMISCSGNAENPLQVGSQEGSGTELNVNSTSDLSKIIVGNSGGYVQTIQYVLRGGLRQGQLRVYGAGPKGTGSGSIYLWFLSTAGRIHTVSLTSSSPDWHTDDFEDTTPIIGLWWGPNPME
jgi:hypothetical protein